MSLQFHNKYYSFSFLIALMDTQNNIQKNKIELASSGFKVLMFQDQMMGTRIDQYISIKANQFCYCN